MMDRDLFREKCLMDFSNMELGQDLLKRYINGEFEPIFWDKLSDDDFIILAYDLDISDNYISKMFKTSTYQVMKRRNKLLIPKGAARHRKWVDEDDRGPVYLDEIIKNISKKGFKR